MDLRSKDAIESSKQHDIDMNNTLIAEFMGLTNHYNDNSMMVRKKPEGNVVLYVYDLDYDSSWDWLMPVVQKIEQDCEGVPKEMLNISLYNDINEVYQAVVEFIKYYNQNN